MARTIEAINKSMLDEVAANSVLSPLLTSTSTAAVFRLFIYIIAGAIWISESLFDEHKAEVLDIVENQKPHKEKWYKGKALAYQHGRALVADQDYYDNTGLTDAQIEAEKVVKYVAVVETSRYTWIKVAGVSGGDLAQLTSAQFAGFQAYMNRVKDTGVRLKFLNQVSDSLKLTIDIYYDPLVLTATGERIDGTSLTPVKDAILSYLKDEDKMPFNGLFVLSSLTDELQKVEGVVIPVITDAQARYGLMSYAPVSVEYQPDSGYLRFANIGTDLVINYIAHEPI